MYWTVTRKVKNLNQVNAWIIYQDKSTLFHFTLISFEKVFYNSKMESWKHEIAVVVHTTERLNKRVNWIMSYLHISSNVCIKKNKSYFLFFYLTIFMKKKTEFMFHFWTIRLKRLSIMVNGPTIVWRLCEWMKDQILILFSQIILNRRYIYS